MELLKCCSRVLVFASALVAASTASALQINYDGLGPGSEIHFFGNSTFVFAPLAPGNNISITSTLGGTGSANGLTGSMSGTFAIGTVTTSGPVSTAPVTGTGTFLINADSLFSANLSWLNISQFGTGSSLNTSGGINLTNIVYAGSNPDLLALKGTGAASNVVTFNFVPALSLSALKTTETSTSFSGSLAPVVPDGGSTVALLGLGLVALVALRRKLV